MTIDLRNYNIIWGMYPHFVFMQRDKSRQTLVSMFSLAYGCPVVVSAYFYKKYFGDSPEVNEQINFLTNWYHDEIVGVEEFMKGEKENEEKNDGDVDEA